MATTLTPFGGPSIGALESARQTAKKPDIMAPVTIVPPSNYSGLSLRRRMGRDGGLVNVRFMVLSRIAELVGAPSLAGTQKPLSTWDRAEAIRVLLMGEESKFADLRDHHALESGLGRAFEEIRRLDGDQVQRLAGSSGTAAEVVRLYSRFREITESFYDLEDLYEAAAEAVLREQAALRDLGRVVLFLPRPLSPGAASFVRNLNRRQEIELVLGLSHEDAGSQLNAALLEQLGLPSPLQPAFGVTPPQATAIVRAHDLEEEVRNVVRLIFQADQDGTAVNRIAVFTPGGDEYAQLVTEQLGAAGLPYHGPDTNSLTTSLAGRSALALLRLADSRLKRGEVMDWLTSGPVLERQAESGPPRGVLGHDWDRISRDAGVVASAGQWLSRLDRWADRDGRNSTEAASARRLAAFIRELEERLRPPKIESVTELLIWVRELIERYLGTVNQARSWLSEDEAQAYADLRESLDRAVGSPSLWQSHAVAQEELQKLDVSARRRLAVRVMDSELRTRHGRRGRFGEGVFIGPIQLGRGMDFEQVFVLGMIEGKMPPPPRENPLLPEMGQDGNNGTRAVSRQEIRDDYLAALASAPERTICFSQSSLRAQAKHTPSRWLLESASALRGSHVTSTEFQALRAADWLVAIPSFAAAIRRQTSPANQQEWELHSLEQAVDPAQHFLNAEPSAEAGLAAAGERMSRWRRRTSASEAGLSPWAGGLGADAALEPKRIHSATAFEGLAACPFSYFLQHIGQVREARKPEATIRISAADRGTVMHAALERFLRETLAQRSSRAGDEKWQASDAARLRLIGEAECDRAEELGLTGSPLLWRVDRTRIPRDLEAFLAADEEVRTQSDARFIEAEHSFGLLDRQGQAEPGSWEPVVIKIADQNEVAFRGRIDRVDQSADGSLIVYDYKSGAAERYKRILEGPDKLAAGTRLQLPIYALAARQALGESNTKVSANYWFTSQREGFVRVGYRLTNDEERSLEQALSALSDLIRQGLFPAVPGSQQFDSERRRQTYTNCRFCAYDPICPSADRGQAWQERKSAAGLERYVGLSEELAGPEASGETRDE